MPSTAQVFRSSLPSLTFSRFGDFGAQDVFSSVGDQIPNSG